MLSKAHLTSHSRMSGSRWVSIPLWLSWSWRSSLYSSSVYSCHFFLISLFLLGPYHFCPLSSPTKVCLVKAMVFPVVIYGCESWIVKKAECQRIDAFELWCWRRVLRAPWTARRSNQSILKEINPGCSLEGMMLRLKLYNSLATSCKELIHWKRPWCWERLGAGREGDDRGWDSWMASPTRWSWVWVNSRSWWWTGRPGMLRFMG